MASIMDRMRSAWNAFTNGLEVPFESMALQNQYSGFLGAGFVGNRPDRTRLRINNERSIISSIYTRMSIDIAAIDMRHTRHDDQDRYLEDIPSGLNNCLTLEANIDQGSRALKQDIALTLFDKGVAAIVPVDTTLDPRISGGYDVKTLRVGEITQWYPNHVRVNLYNEQVGIRQEIILEKSFVAIVENPLYSVMNEPNSTLQRLIRKLALLDSVDEATSSGKLDLIIQLPYVIKTEARRQQAEQRAKDIEFQLKNNKYGIAYTDGTEKVTQLNRPAENNLLSQIEFLTNLLYGQLGITPDIMNGTANEAAMIYYHNRTIEPIVSAIVEAMKRTFLTKTARSQGQSIDIFRNPFKLVPMADLAVMVDKFTRNEVLTSNEIRQFMGMKPSSDPKADLLINSNIPQAKTGVAIPGQTPATPPGQSTATPSTPDDSSKIPADTSAMDSVDAAVASAFSEFGITAPPSTGLIPPSGQLDPDLVLSALDAIDTAIDDAFAGLGD